jgi:hypothetical protein
MSKINFTIPTFTGAGSIVLVEGRYKLTTSEEWIVFNVIDIDNPQTPDITEEGVYELEVRVLNSSLEEGWQPTRELDNSRNSNTNFNPFGKSFADRPSYVLQDSKIKFFTNDFICKDARITYLEQPKLITKDQELNMPFVNELQDHTVTLILENLESRRIQTQPPISKQ